MKKIILVSLLTLAFVPARCEEVKEQVQEVNDTTLQQQEPKGGVEIVKRVGAGGKGGIIGAGVGALVGLIAGGVVGGARGGTVLELIGVGALMGGGGGLAGGVVGVGIEGVGVLGGMGGIIGGVLVVGAEIGGGMGAVIIGVLLGGIGAVVGVERITSTD